MRPSILFIVPDQYEALRIKGVDKMILERDESGFFDKVITVHPFCPRTRSVLLNERHEIYEIGFDLLPGASRFSLLRYVQYPLHFFRIIWNVIGLIKKHQIRLIRSNDPYWMGLFGYLGSRICNVPFCVSIHSDYEKRMEMDKNISIIKVFGSYKLAKRLARFIFSQASRVMPIRKTLGEKAVENGAVPEKIRVIPHGIDLTPFTLPPQHDIHSHFGLDASKKIISFVGRLSEDNYVYDVLAVVKKLSLKRKDFVVVMAGGGKEEGRVKADVLSDPILKNHIVLTGFQPRDICFDLRRASKVGLCLMSGYSLIEACAATRPIVSYDVEWHSELVKNGETGFLIKERDIGGVVDSLDWLLDHPDESNVMGQKAKTLVFEHHDLKNSSAIKIRWYSEIMKQGEGGV